MQITGHDVFMLMFFTSFYGLLLVPILVLITIFTPRSLIKRYWKVPYFQNWELMVFSRFPQVVGRTCMLMGATFLKGGREKRQMDDYLDYVPTWFRVVSIVFFFFVFGVMFIFLGSLIGLLIYTWIFSGIAPPIEVIFLPLGLGLIAGVLIYSRSKHYQERHKRNNRKR